MLSDDGILKRKHKRGDADSQRVLYDMTARKKQYTITILHYLQCVRYRCTRRHDTGAVVIVVYAKR
jgi:hypothetical protein